MFNRMRGLALALLVLLAACGEKSGPSDAPQNFSVAPGDGQAVVHFTQQPGLTYWVFLAQGGPGINRGNYLSYPGARQVWPVSDGGIITGLTNGVTYSFFMNATDGSSPAGPETDTVMVTPRLAGTDWVANAPIGSGANTYGLAWGQGKFMTVSQDGNAYTSTDGANWTATAAPGVGPLNGVAFNGSSSLFVAVGDNGTITTSSDASTWTARTSNTTAKLNDVSATGGSYVAVGDGGAILGTSDYTNWVVRDSGVTANLNKVEYIGSNYVAVGDNGTIVTSSDGYAWSPRTSGTAVNLYDVTYGNGRYLVVGANGTILTSTDLQTWTPESSPTSDTLYGATYGSQFVLVGQNGTALYGTDGMNWSLAHTDVSSDLRKVVYALGVYLAVGQGGANESSR